MAPSDRHERRQQRMRGAGASDVQGSFGFDFAGLAPKAPEPTLTPTLGKRKRPLAPVQPDDDHGHDGLPDELSPERDAEMPQVQRTTPVVTTQPLLPQYPDDALAEPDELSIYFNDPPHITTPITSGGINMTLSTSAALSRTSRLTRAPTTPALPSAHPGPSRIELQFQTPNAAQDSESEDELTPSFMPASMSKTVARQLPPHPQHVAVEEVDELSSPPEQRKEPLPGPPSRESAREAVRRHVVLDDEVDELSSPAERRHQRSPDQLARTSVSAGGHRGVALDEQVDELSSPLQQHSRPPPESSARGPTMAARRRLVVSEEEEYSDRGPTRPDVTDVVLPRRVRAKPKAMRQAPQSPQVSVHERLDSEQLDHQQSATGNRNAPQRLSKLKPRDDSPPRKRRRWNGPKQIISVMRIKGFKVRGVTAADVTRTVVEHTVSHKLDRLNERLRQAPDSAARKLARGLIYCTMAFKESANERLLDLQDMNDNLSTNIQKRKALKARKLGLRKEILNLQSARQEIAMEFAQRQAAFGAEKERVDSKMKLSADMFDIQAAVQSGRELARRQGREEEGPEMPVAMMLDGVSRKVGSAGGGLLARTKSFNNKMGKAAGWLEGDHRVLSKA